MKLSSEAVKKIAKLAKLQLSDEEVEKFAVQLSEILSNAEMLNEIDTTGVEPIAQITGLQNVSFADEIETCDLGDKLLGQSPMPIQDHMIKVKSIFE